MQSLVKNKISSHVKPNKQFVVFKLGDDEYGIDILNIHQIKSLKSLNIAKIYNTASSLEGMISIDENIIPVINLHEVYHIKSLQPREYKVVLILQNNKEYCSLIVDEVLDVIEITPDHIKKAPDIFSIIDREYIEMIAVLDARLIMILNIAKLLKILGQTSAHE